MPSTLRTELERLGYSWAEGEMVMQDGSASQRPKNTRVVHQNDAVLDQRWQNGPQLDMPRFIASDPTAVYVCYRDAKSSGLRRVFHDVADYLGTPTHSIPYPEE